MHRSYITHSGWLHFYEMHWISEVIKVLLTILAFGIVFWACYKYGFGQFYLSMNKDKENGYLISGSDVVIRFNKIEHVAISSKYLFGRRSYLVRLLLFNHVSSQNHISYWLELIRSYSSRYVGSFRSRENAEVVAKGVAAFIGVELIDKQ